MARIRKIITNRKVDALEKLKKNDVLMRGFQNDKKIDMLIIMTRDDIHSNRALARLLSVNPKTIQLWKTKFDKGPGDIQALLVNKRGSKSKDRRIISKQMDEVLKSRLVYLSGCKNYLTYNEFYEWVKANYLPHLNYSTLLKHIKANYWTLFKKVKKSNITKEEIAKKKKKPRKMKRSKHYNLSTPEQQKEADWMIEHTHKSKPRL